MNIKITINLIFSFLISINLLGFSNPVEEKSNDNIAANCISFVFVPSNYNGQTISCVNGQDGSLTINAFGGMAPYSYNWDDGSEGFQRMNLGAGTYSVTVTDMNGCSLNSSITLNNPQPISIIQNITHPVSCINSTDGALTATVTGGTPPYTYNWENGSTSPSASNLGCGSHAVTITDANGCSRTAIFGLNCPTVMQVSITPTSDFGGYHVSCPESNDGVAEVSVQFGFPPYSYKWSNDEVNQVANNLSRGINGLTVTDFNGCQVIAFVEMTAPEKMELIPNILSDYEGAAVSCSDATDGSLLLGIINGNAPYTYAWENGETGAQANALNAGANGITVTDATGCKVIDDIELSAYEIDFTPEIISDYNGAAISCADASNGSVKMNVVAGASSPPNVTYAWNTGDDNELLENISAGTYTLTVTSSFGCTASTETTIEAPSSLEASTIATSDYNGYNISIKGFNNGKGKVTPAGGTAPYDILWQNGGTTQDGENLTAGAQIISITDANGCTTTTELVLTEPTALEAFADVNSDYHGQDISCNGSEDGSAIVMASGAVAPYTYTWSNNDSEEIATQLPSGTHQVTITDANGATVTTEVELYDPEPIELEVRSTPSTNPPDGTATVSATGGSAPFSFSWNDPYLRTESTIDRLEPGWYRVTAIDANGCKEEAQVEVEQSLALDCIKENITFTPNGDGRNDFLTLSCTHSFNNDLEIFDRWGNRVFSTLNYDGTWNGMKDNQAIPDGGYFYILSVALPTGKRTFKGSLTIIR